MQRQDLEELGLHKYQKPETKKGNGDNQASGDMVNRAAEVKRATTDN